MGYDLRNDLARADMLVHQVVNTSGILSGAVYFETPDMQKILLEQNGGNAHGDYIESLLQ